MNTKNNKRRQQTRERIEGVLMILLQEQELSQITVSDVCKRSGINRSTFYANYDDIYALANTIARQLEQEVDALYEGDLVNQVGFHYADLFRHIYEHQTVYKTYFKLGYDQTHILSASHLAPLKLRLSDPYLEYRIEFHKAGLNAIIKKWLNGGCQESPEEILRIIETEYQGRVPGGI